MSAPDELHPAQRARVEHLDDAGIADGHVQPGEPDVQEDDVGRAGQRGRPHDRAGVGVDLDEPSIVAGAEQAAPGDVEVEAVRAGAGHGGHAGPAWGGSATSPMRCSMAVYRAAAWQ